MSMTALELVQSVCNALGISEPSTLVGNQADEIKQMLELLNQEGRSLSRRCDWATMMKECSFTAVAAEQQGAMSVKTGEALGYRKVVNNTMWNRTTQQPVFGSVSRADWQGRKALQLVGPYSEYRIKASSPQSADDPYLFFYPAPTAGDSIYFEIVTKAWVCDSNFVGKVSVDDDADIFKLDTEIMQLGLEWRWLRKKGLSYAEEFASYEALVRKAVNDNVPRGRVSMDGQEQKLRPGVYIPIGNWSVT